MTFIGLLDIAALVVILLCAGDALRTLSPFEQPVRAAAFSLVAIGSFGWIGIDLRQAPSWWAVVMHVGFALYALILFNARHPDARQTVTITVPRSRA
jgi:hypothetical protein